MHTRSLRALVVAEDPDIRVMICHMLARLHLEAVTTGSGPGAAELFDSESFDLVVITQDVSRLEAKEVRDSFERSLPGLGVIILCADLIGRAPRRSEVGRHICIPMPLTMQMLQQTIDAIFYDGGSRDRTGN